MTNKIFFRHFVPKPLLIRNKVCFRGQPKVQKLFNCCTYLVFRVLKSICLQRGCTLYATSPHQYPGTEVITGMFLVDAGVALPKITVHVASKVLDDSTQHTLLQQPQQSCFPSAHFKIEVSTYITAVAYHRTKVLSPFQHLQRGRASYIFRPAVQGGRRPWLAGL